MGWNDDSWKDSYDNWKLATPPEHDWPDGEPEEEHPFPAALDAFIEAFCDDVGADGDTLINAMYAKIGELLAQESRLQGNPPAAEPPDDEIAF